MDPGWVTSASPPPGPQRPHLSEEDGIGLKSPIQGGPGREGSETLEVPGSLAGWEPWGQAVNCAGPQSPQEDFFWGGGLVSF